MDVKKELIAILDKNINQEQLVIDLVSKLVFPKLEEMAADTTTPIDDMIVEYLKKNLIPKPGI